jgi:hypothetical protein
VAGSDRNELTGCYICYSISRHGKVIEIFCENMKVLLFEHDDYKKLIFRNYNIDKKIESKIDCKLIMIKFIC